MEGVTPFPDAGTVVGPRGCPGHVRARPWDGTGWSPDRNASRAGRGHPRLSNLTRLIVLYPEIGAAYIDLCDQLRAQHVVPVEVEAAPEVEGTNGG